MKPILFNTEMVRAILDGRKTQTRRIAAEKIYLDKEWGLDKEPYLKEGKWYYDKQTAVDDSKRYEMRPKYQVGDILWVRETWNYSPNWYYCYKADAVPEDNHGYFGSIPWKPSIHMPREAARIFLRVTNVRVERLQDITEEDAKCEGVKDPYEYQKPAYYDEPFRQLRGKEINQCAFAGLWDTCYQWPNTWTANPWIWVYEFERVSKE